MTTEHSLFECPGYFITGTDTGVGKTRVTGGLLRAARELHAPVAGMKPVAAGGEWHDGRLINEDAVYIARNSGQITPIELLNPYCLPDPVSPHIAAHRVGIRIDIRHIVRQAQRLSIGLNLLLIEGAGGWYAPISDNETMADLALALAAPVLLVVGLRLGCLSHALLTAQAIAHSGCSMRGWIGSQPSAEFAASAENIATLTQLLGARPLALLPYNADPLADADMLRSAAAQLLAAHD